MPTFKITLSYDGTDFVGWQRQASGTSIQGLLEDALAEFGDQPVAVIGAGRTDAGVHALGQVASFTFDQAIAPDALVRALNVRLPPDVRVVAAEEAPALFHAQFAARAKTYRYQLWNADVLPPFTRRYAWHIIGALDVAAMDQAARLIEGEHDFAAFQAAGSTTYTTERTVLSSRITRGTGDFDQSVSYEIRGTGFLRHMVRNIVGSLVEVGRGHRDVDWMREILASHDRSRAGPTAPANGLFLVAVEYGDL